MEVINMQISDEERQELFEYFRVITTQCMGKTDRFIANLKKLLEIAENG